MKPCRSLGLRATCGVGVRQMVGQGQSSPHHSVPAPHMWISYSSHDQSAKWEVPAHEWRHRREILKQ